MANTIVAGFLLFFQCLYVIIVESIKAFLPRGVLPRKSIRGEVVLITGAGSGLGRNMAIEFAKLGASVVLWDVNEKGNKETQKMINDLGLKATAHTVDLSKRDQIYKRAQLVKDELGKVDILVNNAGVVSGRHLLDCSDEQIERTMAVNTTAHLYTTRAFLPYMTEHNHGHIVTIASIAGKVGCSNLVDYCASKHGAVGFHEALTQELFALGKTGVKTTVVCPYFIDTGMFDGFQPKSPTILPALTTEHVVDCIIDGVLTNRHTVAVPKANYVLAVCNQIFPTRVILLMNEFFGANDSMNTFRGRIANGK